MLLTATQILVLLLSYATSADNLLLLPQKHLSTFKAASKLLGRLTAATRLFLPNQ